MIHLSTVVCIQVIMYSATLLIYKYKQLNPQLESLLIILRASVTSSVIYSEVVSDVYCISTQRYIRDVCNGECCIGTCLYSIQDVAHSIIIIASYVLQGMVPVSGVP